MRFTITEKQYNYLLPVPSMKSKMQRIIGKVKDSYVFVGTYEDYKDLLNRCKYLD